MNLEQNVETSYQGTVGGQSVSSCILVLRGVYTRIWSNNGDSITGFCSGLDESICKILDTLSPNTFEVRTLNFSVIQRKNIPYGIRVEHGVRNVWMRDGKLVGIYLSSAEQEGEGILVVI